MKKGKLKREKRDKGFTLLEMLVVVLIIGILAAVALPQYRKSVEKAKLSEALINFKIMKDSVARYLLNHGYPDKHIYLKDFPLDVELSGGEWLDYGDYKTDNYSYYLYINPNFYDIEVIRYKGDTFYILVSLPNESPKDICFDGYTEMGKFICKYLESQGWEYREGDI